MVDWLVHAARYLDCGLRGIGRRIEQAWSWHCRMFDADPLYRLLIIGLADLLARRIDPSQLLRWLQRLIMQHLLAADLDM